MKIYQVNCNVYSDTRMGASNPRFNIGDPVSSTDKAKELILEYFKKQKKSVPDFNIELKDGKWSKDFIPEIITVREIEVD